MNATTRREAGRTSADHAPSEYDGLRLDHVVGDALRFLTRLYPYDIPSGTQVQLWEKNGKRTTGFTDITAAADFLAARREEGDIYVSAALAPENHRGGRSRLTARQAMGIPGVWADIDINGTPDGTGGEKSGAAEGHDEALELAHALARPTLVVGSGYGIQAWWLFEEPWIFADDADRQRAAMLVYDWQGALRHRAHEIRPGFGLDSTHDLARLMRLPGGLNFKAVRS